MDTLVSSFLTGYRSSVAAVLARIQELESQEYPTGLSKQLLRVFREAIRTSQRVVERLSRGDVESPESIMRHGQLLSSIHQLTHLVSMSAGKDVPRWAIQPMKSEIGEYLRGPVDILIAGGAEGGNFAYDYRLEEFFRVLYFALGKEFASRLEKELPSNTAVFHFPFAERDNVLAHGAFFHEIGHQIDREIRSISQRVLVDYLRTMEGEIRQRAHDVSKAPAEADRITVGVKVVLLYWAREYCADLIATRILGPAYPLVVVTSPALLGSLEQHSETHPATLHRLKLVLDLLSDPSAGDFFTTCADAFITAGIKDLLQYWKDRCSATDYRAMGWHEITLGLGTAILPTIVEFAQQLADLVLAAVVQETTAASTADQEETTHNYTPDQFCADIRDVLPELERGITINERIDFAKREPIVNDVSTILNVGWACYLRRQGADERLRVSRLIKKSIELAQVRRVLAISRS